MKLSFEYLKSVVAKLPVGYYLKSDVPVEVSPIEPQSYYDIAEHKITISYPQLKDVDLSDYTEPEQFESAVRAMLYHELSHVILTPRTPPVGFPKENLSIVNIFEDERIETILKDYYFNVDFKDFCKRLNHYKPNEAPTSANEFFYRIVRFREGPKKLVDQVDEIISFYGDVNHKSNGRNVHNYYWSVNDFYTICVEHFDGTCHSPARVNLPSIPKTPFDVKSFCKYAFQAKYDPKFEHDIENLLHSKNEVRGRQPKASATHHGRITPRLISRPEHEYKWFLQSHGGSFNFGQNVRLNLFVDCSGSFVGNVDTTNEILATLARLERRLPYFSFTLTKMGEGWEYAEKNHRFIRAKGMNEFEPSFTNHYKSLQRKSDEKVCNIVLFDGCAWSKYTHIFVGPTRTLIEEQEKYFKLFNEPNTILISDESNSDAIEKYCDKCRTIISMRYVDELKRNILNSLQILL